MDGLLFSFLKDEILPTFLMQFVMIKADNINIIVAVCLFVSYIFYGVLYRD